MTRTPTACRMRRTATVHFAARSQMTTWCARRTPSSGSGRCLAPGAMKTPSGLQIDEEEPVVVPPSKTARGSRRRPRSRARDRTITDVRTRGRRRWKQEAGYQLQARVEHACFRDQSMIGDRLRARSRGGRVAESTIAGHVLNQRPERGRPESYSLGR